MYSVMHLNRISEVLSNHGEAIVCREDGLSDFEALRVGRRAHEVTLAAFDLIELQTDDLRDEPLERRKQRLARILAGGSDAIAFNDHFSHEADVMFEHACRIGLEGICVEAYRCALSQRTVEGLAQVKKLAQCGC
jgi:ATP-dependent DNA ligase